MPFHPYLFFGGDCRQAFTRYQEIFGGELSMLAMGDVPDQPAGNERADWLVHASLTFGGDVLMGSDDPVNVPFEAPRGMMCCYEAARPEEATRVFEALADGGTITAPIGETFFSPMFGMCVDRFGTPWMIDTTAPEHPG